ncbi:MULTISPECIES: hypothetical protein [unclassified Streptomyces]|uniref:hypothetical protein n=1 Tax=unclassified Streptomyces TaxID=2593676 RepID=UPI0007EC5EC6|nr:MULTISPECIES: hypothetical protein [unclassified Streptomyces]MCP3768071.1 hypothetical protein [Streptomyces sp. MAR25Y5]OBQ53064.1 hypothetical protein A4U61_02230 [Streptomyces sp. H-KF8]
MRFVPSDVPVLTSTPPRADDEVRAARRTLALLGRSHLGGHLLLPQGPGFAARDRAAREHAVRRAVAQAVRDAPHPAPGAPG